MTVGSSSAISLSSRSRVLTLIVSVSSTRLARWALSEASRRMASSTRAGTPSISTRFRAAASSSRSIALSGSDRSCRYRLASRTDATIAGSPICTLWCDSYRVATPRRISIAWSAVAGSMERIVNRRRRPGSLSFILRTPSGVVDASRRHSPRASIGLSSSPTLLPALPWPNSESMPLM